MTKISRHLPIWLLALAFVPLYARLSPVKLAFVASYN